MSFPFVNVKLQNVHCTAINMNLIVSYLYVSAVNLNKNYAVFLQTEDMQSYKRNPRI